MGYEEFERFVKMGIKILRENAHESAGFSSGMSPARWLLDFNTLRIGCGRRVGKTRFVQQYARGNHLVIVPNIHIKDQLYGDMIREVGEPPMIATPLDFRALCRPSVIWVDESRMVEMAGLSLEDIAERYARSPGQMMIAFD